MPSNVLKKLEQDYFNARSVLVRYLHMKGNEPEAIACYLSIPVETIKNIISRKPQLHT